MGRRSGCIDLSSCTRLQPETPSRTSGAFTSCERTSREEEEEEEEEDLLPGSRSTTGPFSALILRYPFRRWWRNTALDKRRNYLPPPRMKSAHPFLRLDTAGPLRSAACGRSRFEELKGLWYLNDCVREGPFCYSFAVSDIPPKTPGRTTFHFASPTQRSTTRGGGPDGKPPIFARRGTDFNLWIGVMQRRKDLSWAYMPFGGGSRVCIGSQLATTSMIYTTFRLARQSLALRSVDEGVWTENLGIAAASVHGNQVRLAVDTFSSSRERTSNLMYFNFDLDWQPGMPLVVQAWILVSLREHQGYPLRDMLLEESQIVAGLPTPRSLIWLWHNAMMVEIMARVGERRRQGPRL
ncbi:hypothetical protein B0T22DRAFT_436851 [Podospora appendiculata]|uniref:Cytochrome P450 n=1 Tax=Podospora appendiculata TaxID=314037 RepID=A0AAE1CGF9_9PEZI|nr:hypothetical protein B0T22DRAFT_436851 [Podospora appendiculata]